MALESIEVDTTVQPEGVRPWPARLSAASEAGSAMIDYLLPHARREFLTGSGPFGDVNRWAGAVSRVDEPAHAVLRANARTSGLARRQFEQAVEHGIESVTDPVPEVVEFFETVDNIPPGIDLDFAQDGMIPFRRIDPINGIGGLWYMFGFVFGATMPNASRSMATGRVSVDSTKRMVESGVFAKEAMTLGGLERFGPATKSACRLRLVHAAVSISLSRKGDWDEAVYGAPISLGDTLGASMLGVPFVALAAQRLGYRFTDRELEAMAQLGAMFAYRMGTPVDLLPVTWAQQRHLVYLILRTSVSGIDPESTRKVLDSLNNHESLGKTGTKLFNSFAYGYARLILGEELCDAEGVPDSPFKRVIPMQRPLISAWESVRVHVPGANRLTDRVANWIWEDLFSRLFAQAEGTSSADQFNAVVDERITA
ncbi:oxygenase MpaB family protein [Mycobacterium sp. SM3041]|uniref:oxygenase MpaB family protein n=1 Tax=Mycobacterium sp. SM3041 TaxID=3114291 RepID=UPI00320477C1